MCRVRSIVKTDTLISHEDLRNCRSTDTRHTRGKDKELWLVEGETKLVNLANIERRIIV